MIKLVLSVLQSLFWSFFARPVLMRLVFSLLSLAAKQTDNALDDQWVRDAKARYYQKPEKPHA